jgi:hypothetical protein
MPGSTEDPPRAALQKRDAVELGSAWLCHRAEAAGVRVILLKGPGAAHLRLRAEKVSSDIDVLVEPGGLDALADEVRSAGWLPRFVPLSPRLVESHSLTLYHPGWPVDLDLHTYWPGFLADRGEVFELLWRERVPWSLGGVPVVIPDATSSALILALHSLRRPRKERRSADLDALVASMEALFPASDRSILLSRAAEVGAIDTARPFLERLGLPVPPGGDHRDELRRWRMNTEAKGYTDAWLLAFSEASWWERPGVLARAILPSEREMRGLHPDIPPGHRAIARARFTRLARGAKEIPHALKSFIVSGRRGVV